MMTIAVIACEVMRYELEMLCAEMVEAPALHFLRQGLHDTPKLLKEELQAKIGEVEASAPQLSHLVLGSVAAYREEHTRECGTYWFSPGWLTCSVLPYLDNRSTRLARYVKKYGQDKADILMQMEDGVLSHYNRACLIQWPDLGEHYREQAAEAANRSKLPLSTLEGSPRYLKALLTGPWDTTRFARIPPGHTICQSMETREVICAKKQ